MVGEQKNIKVVVRVRPYNQKELEQNTKSIIKVIDETTLLFDPEEEDDGFFFQGTKQKYRDITKRVSKKMSMEFDRVFDVDATNLQIFEECTAPLVDSVLNGYNCSVFVYGATGAGKTFTMLGSYTTPGLTFLTMSHLFDKMKEKRNAYRFDVGVSYLEVYNEQVMNLLTKTGPLKLQEDTNGVVVSGLSLKPIYSAEELLELLAFGNSNRTQHPTDANAESSRSHAIFQVHIRMTEPKTGSKRMVKLSMIDLAGSERAASTKGLGLRFKEGASINKSLLALGNCINKLADGLKHIPYRDSNLTRILKDSLGGNCQTLMVANASMSSLTYEDTYNTLKYASRAKKIRSTLRQNVLKSNMPKDFYIKKVNELMEENDRLKRANAALEPKIPKGNSLDEGDFQRWCLRIDVLFSEILKVQEKLIGLKSRAKILAFRDKLKTNISELLETFPAAHNVQKECATYISSTPRNPNKQINKLRGEIEYWDEKLGSLLAELNKLKSEVKNAKCANNLQIFLKKEYICVDNAQQLLGSNHRNDLHFELQRVIDLSYKIIKDACLTREQRHKIENVQQWFYADILKNNDDHKKDFSELVMANKEFGEVNGYERCQRIRIDEFVLNKSDGIGSLDSEESGNEYLLSTTFTTQPNNKRNNMNETKVLFAPPKNSNGDTPFDICSTSTANNTNKETANNFITSVLCSELVEAPKNTEKLKDVLLKSRKFTRNNLLKAVAVGVQKENKKISPNRVLKSSRHMIAKASGASVLLGRRLPMRQVNEHSNGLPVRINRAASLRVKK
uniref:Kinesin motor domain-containing protein n=1 Tax=Glossina morsitans morsitans TaxID=37546 RepID=A0A1B0G3A9_GLOMM